MLVWPIEIYAVSPTAIPVAEFHISAIRAKNFREFDSIDMSLGKFNVITGPMRSRSSLLQAFFFLWYVRNVGFRDAMILQEWRGPVRSDNILSMEYHLKSSSPIRILTKYCLDDHVTTNSITFKFSIKFSKEYCEIVDDRMEIDYNRSRGKNTTGKITIAKKGDAVKMSYVNFLSSGLGPLDIGYNQLLLESRELARDIAPELNSFLAGTSVYDFVYPENLKSPSYASEKKLDLRGSNLAGVVHHMLQGPKKAKSLQDGIKSLIPDVKSVIIKKEQESIKMFLDTGRRLVPAEKLPDSVAYGVAMLACLYSKERLSVIESPERGLDMKTLERLADMMDKPHRTGQWAVSTGSMEILERTAPENTFVTTQDKNGKFRVSGADKVGLPVLRSAKKLPSKKPGLAHAGIKVRMDGIPPKKTKTGSVWGEKQYQCVADLRLEIHRAQKSASMAKPFQGRVRIELNMSAPSVIEVKDTEYVGDLDSFVAGVCDAIQPAHSNVLATKEFGGPEETRPDRPLLICDDSQIVEIAAKKTESKSPGYTLTVVSLDK